MWELPSWQSFYGLTPSDWPMLREAGRSELRPTAPDHVRYWLGHGLGAGRKRIQSWIAGLGDRLTAVDIDGQSAYLLREDLEELATTPTTTAVRLLPRYDQWVLGPGTADAHVVPPATRTVVSRGANIVIVGGVVAGTWSLIDNQVVAAWSAEAEPPAPEALAEEVARLATILDQPLRPGVRTA